MIRDRLAKKFIILPLLLVTNVFLSCKPEMQSTQFNALVKIPDGKTLDFYTDEGQAVDISFAIDNYENAQEQWIKVVKDPLHGQLNNCETAIKSQLRCQYLPNNDYYGLDTVELSFGDGGMKTRVNSILKIHIAPVNDAPIATDATFGFQSGSVNIHKFVVPLATDSDHAAHQLQYILVENDGANLQNCFGDYGIRECSVVLNNNFEGQYNLRYRVQDSDGLSSQMAEIKIIVSKQVFQAELVFDQNQSGLVSGVDIVWVIDDSGSMTSVQAQLRANLSAFIDNFVVNGQSKFPFKMAVTTTDRNSLGVFRKNPATSNLWDLSSSAAEQNFAQFKENFENATLVGTQGSGNELALPSLWQSFALNPSWFGGNDRLLVGILITDEQEQSGSYNKTIAQWSQSFKGLKDSPEKVKIYPIVNFAKDMGNRFLELSQNFGTNRYDIYSSYNDILNDISLNISNLITQFQFNQNHQVILSTVTVFVNNALVSSSEFTVSSSGVNFVNPPAAGSSIKIRYQYTWK